MVKYFNSVICLCVGSSFLAIIVTGGERSFDGTIRSVEVLKSDGTAWCTLPDLPGYRGRQWHTQSGLLTCGGFMTDDNCVRFSDGHWNKSYEGFDESNHCAWSSKHGTRLIGGYSTVLLGDDGETQDSFSLRYYTM